MAGIAGRWDRGCELMDIGPVAGLLELPPLLELGADGQRIGRLALVVKRVNGAEDDPVRLPVEVLRPKANIHQDLWYRPLGDQHRAQDRLLGLDVLRRDRGVRGGYRQELQALVASTLVDHHRLDRGDDARSDLDLDHVRAKLADRLSIENVLELALGRHMTSDQRVIV